MKIKNLKDFNSLLSSNNLCILSQKEENEMNNIHKINDSNNSISKNGLIDNNNDNISSVINSLNIRKSNLPEQKKDKKIIFKLMQQIHLYILIKMINRIIL